MYTVGLYTLGCKVSLYETEAVAESFEQAGFLRRPFEEVCDVYVINTCTVTAESDAKSRKFIRRAVRSNPHAVVIVIGCYGQRAPEEVAGIEGVSAVIGTASKMQSVAIAQSLLADRAAQSARNLVTPLDGTPFEPMRITSAPRTRAYVKIEDGCECRCTYCAIAAARGPVRSKPRAEVISEVEGLYAGGTSEVVLTGIETGSYGADFADGYGLSELLCELDERHSCDRIRLGSMAPELLGEKFITKVAGLSILAPHFHVSMQSGSSSVLRGMKRRYNREMALGNIARIRELIPYATFTADLMVGFPGESEADFLDTLSFVSEAGLLDAHVFAYSRRAGTPAAEYPDQIPEGVKQERSRRLIAEKNRVRDEVLSKIVASGRLLPTVLETEAHGYLTGHSDTYAEVKIPVGRAERGELVLVRPTRHENGVIYGDIAENL